MNIDLVKRDLLNSLKADPEYRHAWNLENVYTGVSFQIRALREQRGMSQSALGKEARMAQERISILEDPGADTKPTLNTLLRIADACDVGLDVRFVPYSTVIERSTKTNLKELEVSSFESELPDLERELDAVRRPPAPIGLFDQATLKTLSARTTEEPLKQFVQLHAVSQPTAVKTSEVGLLAGLHPTLERAGLGELRIELSGQPELKTLSQRLVLRVQNPAATGSTPAQLANVVPMSEAVNRPRYSHKRRRKHA